jgi:hypothetical protein
MSFPKKGKFFPGRDGRNGSSGSEPPDVTCFSAEIAAALDRALGSAPAKVKIAAGWTGANERTAKNWFSGRYGPSGEHLVALARNSDEVFSVFLAMAGRPEQLAAAKLMEPENVLSNALTAVRSLKGS